ncbi:hypothetical protein [Spiroplasma taiwanense]|uniref:Uncharacterized protein n=1 Tax=Spiroplasma taiwanense CT-1 TaxID=1276220 RepID=S5MAM0_9MOLU|nr:hypothetical protein [Spiroplasma taiwanense]AGR40803.1 hypothetical protein STAIW_v1c01170 [Spiroplasma taiwanense CT-1]
MCSISDFSIYLKNKNINHGLYNNLLIHISNSSILFQFLNEMNSVISFAPGTKGGLIFKYGHTDNKEVTLNSLTLNYKTSIQLVFNWYFLNLLRSSLNFDTQQLIAIKKQSEIMDKFKIQNNLNLFNHFSLLRMGENHLNKTLDDIWSIISNVDIGVINNYFNINLTNEQEKIDTSLVKNDFRFSIENSDLNEDYISNIKSIVIYEIMFLLTFLYF